jgi:uncharacterized ion transporter superfamily protein YfcC
VCEAFWLEIALLFYFILIKLNLHLSYDPVFAVLAIYSKITETYPCNDMYSNVYSRVIQNKTKQSNMNATSIGE